MSKKADEAEQLLKPSPKKKVKPGDWLSTGSTTLNLACAGRQGGGLLKGKYYLLVGDSASGKTILALTTLAEACNNANFADYQIIYDNVEDGALMDFERFYGRQMAKRVRPPAGTRKEPEYSKTLEEFYYNLDDATKRGTPFIYVLDSIDPLETTQDREKYDKTKAAVRKGKEAPGDYGMAKAKRNSQMLRRAFADVRDSGSILIVIAQSRDDLRSPVPGAQTRGGGRALKFYATLELWTKQVQVLKQHHKDKDREIGIVMQVTVKKNRVTGRIRKARIPIYYDHGIDDLGSCVDYLLDEKHWTKTKGKINAKELGIVGTREEIVEQVQEEGREDELQGVATEVFREIEASIGVKRKSRYS